MPREGREDREDSLDHGSGMGLITRRIVHVFRDKSIALQGDGNAYSIFLVYEGVEMQ